MRTLEQFAWSNGRFFLEALTRKRLPIALTEKTSLKVNQNKANSKQLKAFKFEFNTETVLPSYVFVLGYRFLGQLLLQANIPSKLAGLIHLSTQFKFVNPHDFNQDFDVKVTLTGFRQSSKGILYSFKTSLYQKGVKTIENANRVLDKSPTYKSSKVASVADSQEVTEQVSYQVIADHSVSLDTAWRYAKLSGDFNPIHLHNLSAKLFGLPNALIHGMYNLHWSLAQIDSAQLANWQSIKVSFNRPCYLPNTMSLVSTEIGEYSLYSRDYSDRFLTISIK